MLTIIAAIFLGLLLLGFIVALLLDDETVVVGLLAVVGAVLVAIYLLWGWDGVGLVLGLLAICVAVTLLEKLLDYTPRGIARLAGATRNALTRIARRFSERPPTS